MMFRGRVAAVSYLNTVPFIYGIERADDLRATLLLSPPSGCAEAFNSRRADVALIPAGALTRIEDAEIVTPFCIGATGRVRTVTLMSDSALTEISRIWLDSHSITSALLTRILCQNAWRISPESRRMDDYAVVDNPRKGDAFLLIGDKVFDYEGRFANVWDLSVEWTAMTGLPFVFAVWVARRTVPRETLQSLENALEYGTRHIREAIAHGGHSGKPYAYDYLTHNIDYRFDESKRQALMLFRELITKLP